MQADLPIFFEHQLDPDATRMAAYPSRDEEAFMAHWASILEDESVVVRTVLVGGQVAGNVVSWDEAGERAVGYWIGRPYWGRGVATAALSAFLSVVDERPLRAHVATYNVASLRVLQKCGFVISGHALAPSFTGGADVEEAILTLGASETP